MICVQNPFTLDMRQSNLSNIYPSDTCQQHTVSVRLNSGLEMTAGEMTVSGGNWTVTERAEKHTETVMSGEEEALGGEATVEAGVVAAVAAVERAEKESTIRGEVRTVPNHFCHFTFP